MVKLSKRILGFILSMALVIGGVPIYASDTDSNKLMADQLEQGTLTTALEAGNFQIMATEEKTIKIDGNEKVAEDGTTFTQRIKLGGSGNVTYRSIHMNVASNANITVYAMSSSSSADRALDLYSLDGTLVDSMEAPGAGLNMKTFAVEAGDYYLASPSSGVNVYGVAIEEKEAFPPFSLGVSSLDLEKLETSKAINGFTIAATAEKTVTIDGNNKTAEDGTTFTQRIKLGGSGDVAYRSIHFNLVGKAEVSVYAMSSSSSSDRALDLYALDGTLVDSMEAPGAGLNMKTFTVEAGDYYLASPSSGVNLYDVVIVSAGGKTEVQRLDWAEVLAPVITEVKQEGTTIDVSFTLVTGVDGADKAEVYMMDDKDNIIETKLVGKTGDDNKVVSFTPEGSGQYSFKVNGMRNDSLEGKASLVEAYDYLLPLSQPVVNAFNNEDGSLTVKWNGIQEAEKYVIDTRVSGTSSFKATTETTKTEAIVKGLTLGKVYDIRVRVVRGKDELSSEVIAKKIKEVQEREWAFTYFGQSTKESINTFEMVDEDAFTFRLNSATMKEDGTVKDKGGKFTTYHDGVSFYYTVVDPEEENFELTATFLVDFINPTPDGQEGFGLLAMDSLGEYGVSSTNHYTNSAGVIATKFESVIDGIKYSSKDTVGSRFVTGITPEVLASGDSGIATNGKNVSNGFSYKEEDLIQAGKSYTLTLKKTNTGYQTSIDGYDDVILYGTDKLLQLDEEHLYVGFAVARGCNVTVSDVQFKTSDPATDPEAQPEPIELVSYTKKIDSPTTTSLADYKFVYVSDVPGKLSVTSAQGDIIVDEATLTGEEDFTKNLMLEKGVNTYSVAFTPDGDYVPGENQLLESYDTVTMTHQIEYRQYDGDVLYVTQSGTSNGDGTKANPLDIKSAVLFAKAGQSVELADGTYMMTEPLVIPRGNDGVESAKKVLRSVDGGRAILNFSNAQTGMTVWGDYWMIQDIDITQTPGNKKGLQIAGSYNTVSGVKAYKNGDTGIQISGTSSETIEKWPSNNLILNCTSYDNMDPGMNNADGFAAKITVAQGNVFDGCMAYNNLDDGWDLFAKVESGPIGEVTIKNCIAFNNGTLTDGTGDGDGNGFKLGGDGIAVAHKLIGSISFNNNAEGITSNSNPAVVVENCTSYGNKGKNISLYGKGTGQRAFVLNNVISMAGVEDDNISEMPELASDTNYLSVNGIATNKSGATLDTSIFQSVDVSIMPSREADGSIDMNGLLVLNAKAPKGIGGSLSATSGTMYVVQPGDTLAKIAAKFYQDAKAWEDIYQANRDIVKNPQMIFVGQEIVIP